MMRNGQKWIFFGVISSIFLILIATLFPFNFLIQKDLSIKEIVAGFHHVTNVQDFFANIFLFIPFGFGCSWLMSCQSYRKIQAIFVILPLSLSLSTAVEVLQIFLPHRFSTKADILANSLGGLLGSFSFFLYYFCSSISLKKLKQILKPKYLAICLISYFTVAILITIPLSKATSLSNWSTNFPLILGNEATGDRPWQGYLAHLSIFNHAFSQETLQQFFAQEEFPSNIQQDSLLASYQLSGKENYQNQTNQIPVLAWQRKFSSLKKENQSKKGVYITSDRWLVTPLPATLLSEEIRKTSQFTLCTIIATANLKQTGPARIISLSSDPYQRNLTLGQEEKNLVFRLRNPLMGENGANFELLIPNVFIDTNYHRLAISYENSIIKIYLDSLNNFFSWQLIPEAALFTKLSANNFSNYSYEGMFTLKILYYLLVFVPLGFLLALFSLITRRKIFFSLLVCSITIVFFAGFLQSLLAIGNTHNLDLTNFCLSIAIAIVTFFLVRNIIYFRVLARFKPV